MIFQLIISAILSYLLGSINTSIIVSSLFGMGDIRQKGSGNAGATNTLRVVGAKAAVLVVIGDALKGIIAVLASGWICRLFNNQYVHYCQCVAAVMVVVGHVFPLYFGFKGGKGIMTAISVIFVLNWHIGLVLVAVFTVVILCFGYVSLASCVSAFVYPFIVLLFKGDAVFVASSVIIALIAIVKHRTNIIRLINGTESKLIKKK